MAIERTLSIIKPDAVAKNVVGKIVDRFETAGLKVVAAKLVQLSRAEAEASTPCTLPARSSKTWLTSWFLARCSCRFWKAKAPF